MTEAMLWLGRIVALLPQIIDLWDATKNGTQRGQLEAQLALVRKMEDEQAREEIARA